MAKKLTAGQKKARALVRDAAKRVIAELDLYESRRNCVEFDVHFHLSCWQHMNGNPNHKQGWPVYVPLHGRVQ
jgi:hypothetical protein